MALEVDYYQTLDCERGKGEILLEAAYRNQI